MAILTSKQIHLAFPGAKIQDIQKYWPSISDALVIQSLVSADFSDHPEIVAYALGTIAAETADFVPKKEFKSKYNTLKQYGDLYENRRDLGNTKPGDGARYIGRGFVQLTGRSNYQRYGLLLGVPLIEQPDLANDPGPAAMILALFIKDRLNQILTALQRKDMAAARKAVNGGRHGLEAFVSAYHVIFRALT